MHILLDHISALLIAGVLFVSVFTMMHRNRQNAVELQVNQIVNQQAYDFLDMLERDIENMLSADQLNGVSLDSTCFLELHPPDSTGTETFKSFSFPSMEVYTDTVGFVRDSVALVHLTYRKEPTGLNAMVNGEEQPLYIIYRDKQNEGPGGVFQDGSSGEMITDFSLLLFNEGGGSTDRGACPSELGSTKVEFEAASVWSYDYTADDRYTKSKNNLNTTRYGATIYSPNR